jgi:hypothetical protein
MLELDLSMTPEEEWSSLVLPYAAAAESLGFSRLERRVQAGMPPSPDTTVMCADFYFDGRATFLDLSGTLARGPHHSGLLIGFNSVQLSTFVRKSELALVLTSGIPPAAAIRAARRRWNPIVKLLEMSIPDEHRGIQMAGPEDLAVVLRTHRARVSQHTGSPVQPGEPSLEQRWILTAEWEANAGPLK